MTKAAINLCLNHDCTSVRVPGRSQRYCASCNAASTKICSQCSVRKPRTSFNQTAKNSRSKDGRSSWCRDCHNARQRERIAANHDMVQQRRREYRERNRETLRQKASVRYHTRDREKHADAQRWWRIKKKYGITREQYEALSDAQGGRCAICDGLPTGSTYLVVDHDHFCCPGDTTCGKCLRGLLCGPCNLKLGWLEKHWPAIAQHASGRLVAA